jgi:hypothetical protein
LLICDECAANAPEVMEEHRAYQSDEPQPAPESATDATATDQSADDDGDHIADVKALRWSEPRNKPYYRMALSHEQGPGWVWLRGDAGDDAPGYTISPRNVGGRSKRVTGYVLLRDSRAGRLFDRVGRGRFATIEEAKAAAETDFAKRHPS